MAKISPEDKKNLDNVEPAPAPFWSFKSLRFYMAFLLLFAVFTTNVMRDNLGMAILCMVKPTTTETMNHVQELNYTNLTSSKFESNSSSHDGVEGNLEWSSTMQGFLFSSISYGSIITAFHSGYYADKYGPRRIAIFAITLFAILNLLTPVLAEWNYWAYLVARAGMGIAEGCMFPTIFALSSRWFLPIERGTAAAIFTSGYQAGVGVSDLVGSRLCSVPFLGGWPLIFYISGLLGFVCLVIWCLVATNSPFESKIISDRELVYFKKHLNDVSQKNNKKNFIVPWRSLLLSTAVWGIIINDFASIALLLFMQQFLPTYLRDVLDLDINTNGVYSAIPFFSLLVTKNVVSILAEKLKQKGILSMTASCKIAQCVAAFGTSCIMMSFALLDKAILERYSVILLFFFGVFCAGFVPGAVTAMMLIAPPFTGIISSLGNIGQIVARLITPTAIGYIISKGTAQEWMYVFIMISAFNMFSGFYFMFWGSAEVQDWATPEAVERLSIDRKEKLSIDSNNSV